MSDDVTEIELKNEIGELARLAEALEAFAARHAIGPRTIFEMNLALEEIITNTISYGYNDSDPHLIRIELQVDGETLRARIEDDARAFDPTEAPDPDVTAALVDRPVGGLGVRLVRTLMDDVRYARESDRNILHIARRIGDGAAAPPRSGHPGKEGSL